MPVETGFVAFSISHWTVLALTFTLPFILAAFYRNGDSKQQNALSLALAVVLLANKAALLVYSIKHGDIPWQERLPMHLCDWTTFVAAIALATRRQAWFELAYFWGLAGTLQAVLTPDLAYDFPHFYFLSFHISHSGIIVGILYLCLGPGLRPWPASLGKAFAWLQFYLLCAAMVNLLLDTNYGYLCRKPAQPSLLDYFGPWPWYILTLEAAAFASFLLYYAPFSIADQIKDPRKKAYPAE